MTLLQRVEVAALKLLIWLSRGLGPVRASDLGGFVLRTVGPWLPVSRIARRNVAIALPQLDPAAQARVVRQAWDNLGRTVAELPHVASFRPTPSGPGWDIEGFEHVEPLRLPGVRSILVTGHFGNWELLSIAAYQYGMTWATFYRAPSNPGVDRLLAALRNPSQHRGGQTFAKGAAGAKAALAFLRAGGMLAFFMDQKMNDGIPATLFGRTAMTASALASMGLRFRCPVLPVRIERMGAARFHIVVEAPLELPDTGDRATDIQSLTQSVNDTLERWIAERPGDWLLMHRRWPKEEYR